MPTTHQRPGHLLLVDVEGADASPGVGGEAVEPPLVEQPHDEAPEAPPQPWDQRHRGGERGPGRLEVVGLEPHVGGRESLAPVLLRVATPSVEAMELAVHAEGSLDLMVEAQDAVVTLHARHPGVPAHDAR